MYAPHLLKTLLEPFFCCKQWVFKIGLCVCVHMRTCTHTHTQNQCYVYPKENKQMRSE